MDRVNNNNSQRRKKMIKEMRYVKTEQRYVDGFSNPNYVLTREDKIADNLKTALKNLIRTKPYKDMLSRNEIHTISNYLTGWLVSEHGDLEVIIKGERK
jgi:hypothetical protein